VPEALRAAGHHVHLQREVVPSGTHDIEWLPIVGRRKWVLITKDERIRRRTVEMQAYLGAGVRGFVMTAAGEMRGIDQGALIARALPAIVRLVRKRAAPFIANITASGRIDTLDVKRYLRRKD
jgi:hypothetical protein